MSDSGEPTAETPLVENMAVPAFIATADRGEVNDPLLPARRTFSMPAFTRARIDKLGRHMPQTIAHRGYKSKYPENTMGAFAGAADIGAHAIETDIHLSRDGVVVLSHDATLKRCFGQPGKIVDYDWEYLGTLRTAKEPHLPMPRLLDLLKYLARPENKHLWVLLDIKIDNDPDDVMRLIAATIAQVPPAKGRPWAERILLGCWAASYLPLCDKYLPDFPITYIGYSLSYASQFFVTPNVCFNMLQAVLVGPFGARFLHQARRLGRAVYAWTVNSELRMRWCIWRELDGVITDDPKKFLDVCEGVKNDLCAPSKLALDWSTLFYVVRVHLLLLVLELLLRWKVFELAARIKRTGRDKPSSIAA